MFGLALSLSLCSNYQWSHRIQSCAVAPVVPTSTPSSPSWTSAGGSATCVTVLMMVWLWSGVWFSVCSYHFTLDGTYDRPAFILCHLVPDEFMYNPVTRSYGEPHKRPEVQNSTVEFIASSDYMVSRLSHPQTFGSLCGIVLFVFWCSSTPIHLRAVLFWCFNVWMTFNRKSRLSYK